MSQMLREHTLALMVCLWLVLPIGRQDQQGSPSAAMGQGARTFQQKDPALRQVADKSKYAATDLAQVDADFAYQGEYMGPASAGMLDCENLGLQVIALGDGRFDAVLLPGGLPGAGWDRVTKRELSGERKNGGMELIGGQYVVRVSPDSAVIQDVGGAKIASLRRIHRISATQDAPPPFGAIVLFDGSNTEGFEGGTMTEDGLLEFGTVTKMSVGGFRMHIEFRTPYMPFARGQGRGNSGVYIQQRYEVQILDSFGLKGEHNECGGLYKQQRPNVNLCLPPLSWQTYDIVFSSAKWDSQGNKVASARITLLHNGEPVHRDYALLNKTGGGKPEDPQDRPILLQNHGNPVHFRNIWLQPLQPAACEPAMWYVIPISQSKVMWPRCNSPCARW